MFVRRFLSSCAMAISFFATLPVAAEGRLFGDLATNSLRSLPARGKSDAPLPRRFRALKVNIDALEALLLKAPLEGAAATTTPLVIALPYPDGTNRRFHIEESPMLEPELAAKFPEIHTFVARAIDDPTATGRLSLTSLGFHGMVLSVSGTVYIDPYRRGDSRYALSYLKSDAVKPAGKSFRCDSMEESTEESFVREAFPLAPQTSSGTTLRTYRLAMATTSEYSNAVCSASLTKQCVMGAITTTMNRVNGIFEREVAIKMTLVANNDILINIDPGTDPYTDDNPRSMLIENQANLDNLIGPTKYDIGHVFSTGGGGRATVGSPCTVQKAEGVTGSSDPVGDSFDVDFVAHEMGHQFGARHIFNGTLEGCSDGNRNPSSAFEPGSGTTIMGYAGLCDADDIEPHNSDTFHPWSFDQIVDFLTLPRAGGSCGTLSTITSPTDRWSNSPPVVTAPSAYTIPKKTPFTLTGSAYDLNDDPLTYMWEEFDLASAAAPPNDDFRAERPIFRSFRPIVEPTRTFPRLQDILSNVPTLGESMPTRSRTMTFRLTARDNYGGVDSDTTTVTVDAGSGPFTVTEPPHLSFWPAYSNQTVKWDVASTDAPPILCYHVKIDLSTDGGFTFSKILNPKTPNDGTEAVIAPFILTNQARVRVSCWDNIFFDISDSNFIIGPPLPTLTSIAPREGMAGGTVKLTGNDFAPGLKVYFGAIEASVLQFSPNELLVRVPEHALGRVSVAVANSPGYPTIWNPGFTYLSHYRLSRHITTSSTPSVLQIGATTYVFYKGSGTNEYIWIGKTDDSLYADSGSWTNWGLSSVATTSAAPSAIRDAVTGYTYVFYKGSGNNTNIWAVRSKNPTTTWEIARFDEVVNTSTGPTTFFSDNRVYAFYKGAWNDQRMFFEYLRVEPWYPALTATNDSHLTTGGNGTGSGSAVPTPSPGRAVQMHPWVSTSATPSVIWARQSPSPTSPLVPYVFYKGWYSEHEIYMVISNHTSVGTSWSSITQLPPAIRTSDAPFAITSDGGVIDVVYKGQSTDTRIYVARSTDLGTTWKTTKFPPDVATSTGPTAIFSNGDLFVFYKGAADEGVYISRLPANTTWTLAPRP